jgi:RNA polymerase sporulation-specific sigma factor
MENLNESLISELILGVRAGCNDAFSDLVKMYTPLIKKLAGGFCDSKLGEDEAFCEASFAFYRAAMTYDISQSKVTFGLYARICMYRRLCDIAGKARSVREEVFSDLDISAIPVQSNVEDALLGSERMNKSLSKARELLSEYEYSVFVLYLHGYGTAEISRKLGRSSKSVDNAKARCIKRLREESDSFSDI